MERVHRLSKIAHRGGFPSPAIDDWENPQQLGAEKVKQALESTPSIFRSGKTIVVDSGITRKIDLLSILPGCLVAVIVSSFPDYGS